MKEEAEEGEEGLCTLTRLARPAGSMVAGTVKVVSGTASLGVHLYFPKQILIGPNKIKLSKKQKICLDIKLFFKLPNTKINYQVYPKNFLIKTIGLLTYPV